MSLNTKLNPSLHTLGKGDNFDPLSQWLVKIASLFPFKNSWPSKTFRNCFVGMLSPPSPQMVSILIQSNFPFNQHLSFAQVVGSWTWSDNNTLLYSITILCIAVFFILEGKQLCLFWWGKNVCSLLYMCEKQKSQSYWGEKRPFSPYKHFYLHLLPPSLLFIMATIKAAAYAQPSYEVTPLSHYFSTTRCCTVAKLHLTVQPHGLWHSRFPCPSISARVGSIPVHH